MRRTLRRRIAVGSAAVVLALTLVPLLGVNRASAVDFSLPSLWQAYQGDFTMGTFGSWTSPQAQYHYRSISLPNEL